MPYNKISLFIVVILDYKSIKFLQINNESILILLK